VGHPVTPTQWVERLKITSHHVKNEGGKWIYTNQPELGAKVIFAPGCGGQIGVFDVATKDFRLVTPAYGWTKFSWQPYIGESGSLSPVMGKGSNCPGSNGDRKYNTATTVGTTVVFGPAGSIDPYDSSTNHVGLFDVVTMSFDAVKIAPSGSKLALQVHAAAAVGRKVVFSGINGYSYSEYFNREGACATGIWVFDLDKRILSDVIAANAGGPCLGAGRLGYWAGASVLGSQVTLLPEYEETAHVGIFDVTYNTFKTMALGTTAWSGEDVKALHRYHGAVTVGSSVYFGPSSSAVTATLKGSLKYGVWRPIGGFSNYKDRAPSLAVYKQNTVSCRCGSNSTCSSNATCPVCSAVDETAVQYGSLPFDGDLTPQPSATSLSMVSAVEDGFLEAVPKVSQDGPETELLPMLIDIGSPEDDHYVCKHLMEQVSGCHGESTREADEKVRARGLVFMKSENEKIPAAREAAEAQVAEMQERDSKKISCDQLNHDSHQRESEDKADHKHLVTEIEQKKELAEADGTMPDPMPMLPSAPPPAKMCSFEEESQHCKCQ